MATTTGTNNLFDKVKEYLMDGTIDLDDNTFKVALLSSTLEPDVATDTVWADISANEVTGNGATAGGLTLTGVAWVASGGANGQMKFDSDSPQWAATGGSITAHWWVLYRSGTVNTVTDALMAYGLLDDTPADVVTTDGNTLTLNVNANGYFTVG